MSQGQISLLSVGQQTTVFLHLKVTKQAEEWFSVNGKLRLHLVSQKALWILCIFLFVKRRAVSSPLQKNEGGFAEAQKPALIQHLNHGCDKGWWWWAGWAVGSWLEEEEAAACFAR